MIIRSNQQKFLHFYRKVLLGYHDNGEVGEGRLLYFFNLILQREFGLVDTFLSMRTIGGKVPLLAILNNIESESSVEFGHGQDSLKQQDGLLQGEMGRIVFEP
jgi:hypothetical protein